MKASLSQFATFAYGIKTREDITSLVVTDEYEDDHLQCADVTINGLDFQFMCYDNLGFLEYWNDSDKAFEVLKDAIRYQVDMMIEDQPDMSFRG